jgi:hypothetical protein
VHEELFLLQDKQLDKLQLNNCLKCKEDCKGLALGCSRTVSIRISSGRETALLAGFSLLVSARLNSGVNIYERLLLDWRLKEEGGEISCFASANNLE